MQQVDYSTQRFRTSQIAEAAGISPGTLRSYFSRGQWRQIGKQAEGEGLPNSFSLRDALTYSVAARLVDMGADPTSAFEAAMEFAYSGDEERGPTEMFDIHEFGATILVYWPAIRRSELKKSDKIESLYDLMDAPGVDYLDAAVVIILNAIEQRVFHVLGVEKPRQ